MIGGTEVATTHGPSASSSMARPTAGCHRDSSPLALEHDDPARPDRSRDDRNQKDADADRPVEGPLPADESRSVPEPDNRGGDGSGAGDDREQHREQDVPLLRVRLQDETDRRDPGWDEQPE